MDKDWNTSHGNLQKARKLARKLLKTAGPDVFLHGDLHHDNILQNGNDWLAIDPKGVTGEPAYEVAAFIRNPMPDLLNIHNTVEIIQNRITSFANFLDIPAKRIIDWCFVQAVLVWFWALEPHLFKKIILLMPHLLFVVVKCHANAHQILAYSPLNSRKKILRP